MDPHEINPVHIIDWILAKPNQDANKLLDDSSFPGALKELLRESKHPLSLFLDRNYIRTFRTDKLFDLDTFQHLFTLSLEACKLYATNKNNVILSSIPQSLTPEFKSTLDGRFLTTVTNCFRLSAIIDFYNWLPCSLTTYEKLPKYLGEYLAFIKNLFSKAKYKKIRIFMTYLYNHVNEVEVIKTKKDQLSQINQNIIDKFVLSKEMGVKIDYHGQIISDTKWNRTTPVKAYNFLNAFLINVSILRGEHEDFLAYSININDFFAYKAKYNFSCELAIILRQFLAFMLNERDIHDEYKNTLRELFLKLPSPKHLKKIDFNSVSRDFISRKDYVTIIKTALTTCKAGTCLKYAVYVGLAGFCALRRIEVMQLQVEDFDLDVDLKLADVGGGYGRLKLPAYKSKGMYSPSHPKFGTLIVPRLRMLINTYLESNHMKGYDKSTFLMRVQPVGIYDESFDGVSNKMFFDHKWLKKIAAKGSEIMSQIYSRARPLLGQYDGHISSHDLRRSTNNYIRKAHTHLPNEPRIAEIHLRHSVVKRVNDLYTDDPNILSFVHCIDKALNFPWELDELERWEKENLILLSEEDFGEVNGHKKIPVPSQINANLNLQNSANISLPSSSPVETNLINKEIILIQTQINELNSLLKEKGQNKISIEAKIKRLNAKLHDYKGEQ